MTGEELTPDLVAAVDQHLARLRDLVQMARDHRDAHQCTVPAPCPGGWAWDELEAMHPHNAIGLLGLALGELAALGYGLPAAADHLELTEAAEALLDDGESTP